VWSVCTYTNTSQSQSGVYIQKFDAATGVPLLDPLGKPVYPIGAGSDAQVGKLVLSNDDPLFMSYDVNYKIYATRLNSTGDFVWPGNRVELSSTTASLATPKGRFAFTDITGSQVVAVWYENRGIEYRAYAQSVYSNGILPVSLVDFEAIKNKGLVNLSWTTQSENNSKGFYIERSADGIHFKDLIFVPTKAALGNSSVKLSYENTDIFPLPLFNYYRLRQMDADDKISYSKTVLVRFNKNDDLYISNIYPQPAPYVLHISVEATGEHEASLSILDIQGKLLKQMFVHATKGSNLFNVNVSTFASGTYFIRIKSEGKAAVVEKWVKN
jgi:hypothetical protein